MTTVTRLARAAAVAVPIVFCASLLRAEDFQPPVGFQWGPWYVAPSLATGLVATTNPFNQPTATKEALGTGGDLIAIANPAVVATLPFGRSWFRAAYDGIFRSYRHSETSSRNAQDYAAELSLRFASFDHLAFRANRSVGAADVIRFDGGEAVYDGTPYTFTTCEIAAERDVPDHFGYATTLRWSGLSFDSTQYAFFEYSGYEGSFDVRPAVSPTTWLVAGGAFRRFDHYLADDPTHSVYRKEIVNSAQVGVAGVGAHEQSWRVLLRYDAADYPGGAGSNYRGLGGDAYLGVAIGPTSTVGLYASRRNWASFYADNNYYVATTAGVRTEKRWITGSTLGLDVSASLNQYPDVNIDPETQQPLRRRDTLSHAELYANFLFRSVYALHISAIHQGRRSNAGGSDYRADSLGVQFVLGWR